MTCFRYVILRRQVVTSMRRRRGSRSVCRSSRSPVTSLPSVARSSLNQVTLRRRSSSAASSLSRQPVDVDLVMFTSVVCFVLTKCLMIFTGTGASNMYRILFGPNLDDALVRSENFAADEYQTTLRGVCMLKFKCSTSRLQLHVSVSFSCLLKEPIRSV